MPAPLDPKTVADRWVQRLGASTDKIRQGVQAVTTSPTQAAAAAVNTWQQRLADPKTAQKYVASLSRVSTADWQNAMLNKGLNRIASGAAAAHDKFMNFLSQFLPFEANIAQQVRNMPKATLDDRINRAVAQIRGNAAFRRT